MCDTCKASFVSETTRRIPTRISEYLCHDKISQVYKYIISIDLLLFMTTTKKILFPRTDRFARREHLHS